MDDLIAFLHGRLGNDRERAHFLRTLAALQPPDMRRELEDMAGWIERDAAAKRRILDWLERQRAWAAENNLWAYDDTEALKLLALPYADHPGYRAEWRP